VTFSFKGRGTNNEFVHEYTQAPKIYFLVVVTALSIHEWRYLEMKKDSIKIKRLYLKKLREVIYLDHLRW
jgi:hypothetical protein